MTDATDATAPLDDAAPSPNLNRTISPISGRFGPSWGGKAVVLAALVAGCGVFLFATWHGRQGSPPARPAEAARQVVAFEPLSAPPHPTLAAPGPGAPDLGTPASAPQSATPAAAPAPDPRVQRAAELSAIRAAPMLAFSRTSGAGGPLQDAATLVPALAPAAANATELDQLRQGSTIGRVRANRVGDRNFLILAGTAIPCTLQTAMDTTTPGFVSCLIPRDVLSDNGAVVLLEKGTKVLGEYRSTLKQGQRRLFVLWTRAVTPAGVAIALASPAADPLGRAGFDGELDTHFWDRFGGALLLSIVDDGTVAVAGRDTGSATARMPSEAAAIALQNSINIPPSLRKAQGSEVSIFVAQDFDFSSVYGLKAQ
ncbi:type IV secretion system protein VirB10 [Phenylobacterium sp.]|uniref:type IV secretion system protein VirB10 n=1 Tax=Phenylobacterium sp. TaxID=1871053 RepID=UPI0035B4242E